MSTDTSSVQAAILAWLRNDRRLGVQHVGVVPDLADEAPPSDALPPARPHPASAPKRPTAAPAKPAAEQPVESGADSVVATPEGELGPLVDRALPLPVVQQALRELDHVFVRPCTRCDLHRRRRQTVFGVGNPQAELMFVGEGPGEDEDRQGEPFVGVSGQLLTRMISAMTLPRGQVYIANVVKCRPPDNRTPTPEETTTCAGYLWRQIALIRPRVIVALGRPAAQTLLATTNSIGRLRGQFHAFPPPDLADLGLPSCKVMPTYHPAYLLRSPGEKRKTWDDLKQVMEFLDIPLPSR